MIFSDFQDLSSVKNRYTVERLILQVAVAVGACVPVIAGGSGMLFGASILSGTVDISFDSHFRYLSGLLFAIGIGFWFAIPMIERKTGYIRLLALMVFIGGLARLFAAIFIGMPSLPMILAIGMELIVTPLLCLWQARIAKLWGRI